MKRLSLLRHAKSSWDNPAIDDFDRPLNARGRDAAPAMGAFMASAFPAPDFILCSTAARTRETCKLLLPAFETQPKVNVSEALYHAASAAMFEEIKRAPDEVGHLIMIGHNPGIHILACDLVPDAGDKSDAATRLDRKFPTAACAHFEFTIERWRDVSAWDSRLVSFTTPKDLLQ